MLSVTVSIPVYLCRPADSSVMTAMVVGKVMLSAACSQIAAGLGGEQGPAACSAGRAVGASRTVPGAHLRSVTPCRRPPQTCALSAWFNRSTKYSQRGTPSIE